MNASGPALHDIRLPQVPWWPPAPGWLMLAGLIVVLCVLVAIGWRRHRRRRQPWLAARREIAALACGHARDRDDPALLAGISRLLRRIALLIEPAAAVSEGAAWRAFLQRRAPGAFDEGQLEALVSGPYRPRITLEADRLLDATLRWCSAARGAPR